MSPPALIAGWIGSIEAICVLIFLPLLTFWIWMVVDCVRFDKSVAVLLLVLFTGPLGALLYFFTRRAKRRSHQTPT